MRRKIIAFFSILSIAVVSVGSLVVSAASTVHTDTQVIFDVGISSSITRTYTRASGTSAIYAAVSAVNSSDTGNFKFISLDGYQYNGSTFVEKDSTSATGTNSRVSTTISSTDVTNICARGQIGYSSVEATGTKDTIILNVRNTEDVPFLGSFYIY